MIFNKNITGEQIATYVYAVICIFISIFFEAINYPFTEVVHLSSALLLLSYFPLSWLWCNGNGEFDEFLLSVWELLLFLSFILNMLMSVYAACASLIDNAINIPCTILCFAIIPMHKFFLNIIANDNSELYKFLDEIKEGRK